ncbi:hypothetical protein Peur_042846 [Populus x canadensis]
MRQACISMRVSMFSRRPRRRKDGFGRSCRVLGAEACLGGVHKVGVLTLRAVDGVHRGVISPFKVESFVFFADTLVCGKERLVSPFLFYSYEFGLDETSHKGSYFNKVKY